MNDTHRLASVVAEIALCRQDLARVEEQAQGARLPLCRRLQELTAEKARLMENTRDD